ncbi:MAG: hypothetical protein LBU73_05845 [Helicobacteraceae bacterium]|nr:hypothetical protein [Helicobacteraceae bacterium]
MKPINPALLAVASSRAGENHNFLSASEKSNCDFRGFPKGDHPLVVGGNFAPARS